jgi:peptide/nickel transport system permease protein
VFIMVRAIPGDPAQIILGQNATEAQVQALRASMGLDKPLIVQYGIFLKDAAVGDLGDSIVTGRPVTTEILTRLPATLELTSFAMLIAILVGVPVGVIAAVKQYSLLDKATSVLALTGISMPIFWLAMILVVIFTVNWQILPFPGRLGSNTTISAVTGLVLVDSLLTLNFAGFWDGLRHLILPAVALGTIPMAIITRMTRSSMLEVMGEDYVRTARAKGLPERAVIRKHAFRAGLTPLVTAAGLDFAGLLGGAIITEKIFGLPGMGKLAIDSVVEYDLPLITGVTLLAAVFIIVMNLVVDLLYAVIDPRVRVT